MRKRVIMFFLAVILGFSFTGCSGNQTPGSENAPENAGNTAASEKTPEETSQAAGSKYIKTTGQDISTYGKYFSGLTKYVSNFDIKNYTYRYESGRAVIWMTEISYEKVDAEKYSGKIDTAVLKLEEYLETTLQKEFGNESKVHYFMENSMDSHSYTEYDKPVVFLSADGALYFYELARILTKNPSSQWINDGLAVYLKSKLSNEPAFPNNDLDVDTSAKMFLDSAYIDTIKLIKDGEKFVKHIESEDMQALYSFLGSFVKYLEELLGKEKLLEISKNTKAAAALEQTTGKSLSALKKEWLKSLGAPEGIEVD